ncbi:sperm-associated antigen 17-like isoform X4 [Haliotis rufescens]|uniref:sperm-associated antigen 17-like isoform X4 n=1 Tax=Haliotis rufescens TaxID=6454 RepID=UPI00201E8391|nr:sperm-associated antigen 17-like isoform X4 [Haliotis rufescens]
MSKAGKRVKSGTGQQGGAKWEQALLTAALDEEKWKSNISFVVGNTSEDYVYINVLAAAIAGGTRKLFSVIGKESLYNEVRDLGNPKSKKGKEVPAYYEVCEPCKLYLDNGEDIPLTLLARLIKFKLLAIKTTDLKRREAEKKAEQQHAKAEVRAVADKDKGKKDKKDRAKSPKKGGKKTPEPQSAKDGSKLRKRGDEDTESKYIDDEPDDGAQHYVVIYGFHNPHLFGQLSEVGINVDSVIRLSAQDYSLLLETQSDEKTDKEKDEKTLALEEQNRVEKQKLQNEIKKFWRDLLLLLQRNPDTSKLHDIPCLQYEVKALIVPESLEENDQKTNFGAALFEDIAVMIYDLTDAHRLYHTYLDNLKLLNIPLHGLPPAPPAGQDTQSSGTGTPGAQVAPQVSQTSLTTGDQPDQTVDMRYYNDLMNCVPQESVSVPLVMHCMLEQIEASEQSKDPPSEQPPPTRTDGLNNLLASHLTDVAFKLALSESEHKELSDVFDLPERPPDVPRQPLLTNSKDDITMRTHHLNTIYCFNPLQTEKNMLKHIMFAQSRDLPQPTSGVVRERAARLQELIHFCATGTMSPSEIDRAFKQFVFESMDIAGTDSNGFIITRDSEGMEHSAIPWDDPYPYYKGMLNLQEKAHPSKLPMSTSPSDEERSGSELDWTDVSLPCSPTPSHNSTSLNLAQPATNTQAEEPQTSKTGRQGRPRNKKVKRGRSPTPDDRSKSDFGGDSFASGRKERDATPILTRPSTSDSKKGILRPPSRSNSPEKHSRSNSVHFEVDDEGRPVPPHQTGEDEEVTACGEGEEQSVEDSIKEIVEAQKRTLDQWCFAEHFDNSILLQVMKEASCSLPFIDTYYHKRDHSLLVVLHNPYNAELQNHVDWHTELHSNMGFRNYLEYVAESVSDWLKEKEAEYQGQRLSHEVDQIRKDEEEAAKAVEKAAKGSRSKSPGKTRNRSKSPKSSRANSLDRPPSESSNPFVRVGSLKAWKEEQDRIKAEEEEKERAKSEKRSKSPKKKQDEEKEKEDKEKEKKRPGSRGSAKSKASQKDAQEMQETPRNTEPQEEERYWPYTGYDVGNNLIHVSGILTTLFPSDGGQIRTERTDFVQGTTSVCTSVLKDSHVLCVHIIDPCESLEGEEEEQDNGEEKKDVLEKSELEKSEKETADKPCDEEREAGEDSRKKSVSAFGSITAYLSDGMTLALSQFGADGKAEDGKKYEPEVYVPQPISTSPLPQASQGSPSKGKKDKGKGAPTPEPPQQPPPEEEAQEEAVPEEEQEIQQAFQQLYVTCPDGLHVRYFLQSNVGVKPNSEDDRQLVVKQSYPFKTKGSQPCEATRKKYVLTEQSRVITADGTVVKTLLDGTVEVLHADGTVHKHTGSTPLVTSRSSSPQRGESGKSGMETPTKKSVRSARGKSHSPDKLGEHVVMEESNSKKGTWVTTYPSGDRMAIRSDGTAEELKPVMICVASDPETRQSMATRDDHVITVSYPDGTVIVEHSDGTRITTYYRESNIPVSGDDQSETGEAPQMQNQTIKFVKIECPAYATVQFNCKTSESLTVFGSGTNINVFPDGFYAVHHCEGGRIEVDTEGTMSYFPKPNKSMEQILPERGVQYVLRHNADVVCETVDGDGNVFNVKYTGDYSVIMANGDETSNESVDDHKQEKGVTQYGQHAPRFFIIHADGSGTELMRYQDVAEYLTSAEDSTATAVVKDPLPDHPGVTGITILKPYIGGPSDRWLKKYDMESIIPNGIRSRDLTTLPPQEEKKEGPAFGTNVGQGLAIGAAVRSPTRIPILKCPSVLELRQVVQYKPVTETLRNQLRGGLQDYAEYVMARQEAAEEMMVRDPRSEEEKILAADLQATVQSEPRTIDPGTIKDLYEKATSPPVPSPPPTPQSRRTRADWERDQREVAEEIEGRNALRNNNIPSYFESELGKAFLLTQAKDMDQMMKELSEDPRRDGTEAVRGDTSSLGYPQETPVDTRRGQSTIRTSQQSDRSSVSASPYTHTHTKITMETPSSYTGLLNETTITPSALRPGNPTPAHAAGQGSPAPLRPKNPTPAQAEKSMNERPVNPTPKLAGGGGVMTDSPSEPPSQYHGSDYPAIKEQPREEEGVSTEFSRDNDFVLTRSLKVNVTGEPRKYTVPLPSSIQGGRPGAQPNDRFQEVEDIVRRRVNNTVVAGATYQGHTRLQQMRGLNLLPEDVDFGVLKEGYTYSFSVYLRNTGVDSCRFKLQQPPPATGLRVVYKPGPVAAGMKAELTLELYAIAVGVEGESGVGVVSHDLIIVTETDVLRLPIRATVLTSHEFERRIQESPVRGKSPQARLVSTKPPSTTGIIRPRRDQEITGKV